MFQHFYHMFTTRPNIRAPELNETSDNSLKKYHNLIYLAFSAFKVHVGWFDLVNHFFLPPGHSHDLEDQRFKLLKSAFYRSNEVLTWDDFVKICRTCLSSTPMEVITDIFIFDWKAWLQPWIRKLRNHSKWRAFQFSKHPANPDVVVMKWKEHESSPGPFHGSDTYPDGIELLLDLPPGLPTRKRPNLIPLADLQLQQCIPALHGSAQMFWEEVIDTATIPNLNTMPDLPDDYFDFRKFAYSTWQHTQAPVQQERVCIFFIFYLITSSSTLDSYLADCVVC